MDSEVEIFQKWFVEEQGLFLKLNSDHLYLSFCKSLHYFTTGDFKVGIKLE